MFSIRGNPGLNFWTRDELEARHEEARAFARRLFPGDEKWENRLLNLSGFISAGTRRAVNVLPKNKLVEVVEFMIAASCPLDKPYKENFIGGSI
jgi:hypothetical protein